MGRWCYYSSDDYSSDEYSGDGYSSDEYKKSKKQKKCVSKAIKQIYKDNNLTEIYNKSLECDNKICAKEQKIFNINLFRQKQIKIKKSQSKLFDNNHNHNNFENEVDHDLIVRGDL